MARGLLKPLFGDFWLKLSALIISLGIWFYANSRLSDEISLRAVLVIAPPPGHALVHQSAKSVRVTVSGPRSLISRLEREFVQTPLRLVAELGEHDLDAGWSTLRVEQLWPRADLPERDLVQLKFREARPAEVRAFASRLGERRLPVRVHASIQPAPGFRLLAPPTATPPEVLVQGPEVALEAMQTAETNELTAYDVRSDMQRPVGLRLEFPVVLANGEQVPVPLEMKPTSVTVNVSISGEEQQEQRFPGIRLLQMTPPGFPYEVELSEADSTVTVVVRASASNLKKLQPAQIRAYVDLTSLASEQIAPGASAPYRERVRVQLPPGLVHAEGRAEPERVNVLLKNVPG